MNAVARAQLTVQMLTLLQNNLLSANYLSYISTFRHLIIEVSIEINSDMPWNKGEQYVHIATQLNTA